MADLNNVILSLGLISFHLAGIYRCCRFLHADSITSAEPRVLGVTERIVMYVNWKEIRKSKYIVFIGFSCVFLAIIYSSNAISLLHQFYLPPLPVTDIHCTHIWLAWTFVFHFSLPALLSVGFINNTTSFTSFIVTSVFYFFHPSGATRISFNPLRGKHF